MELALALKNNKDRTKDIQQILHSVEALSKGHLNCRDDLEKLIALALQTDNFSVLEDLSFQAKFANGLLKIVQKKANAIDEESFLKATGEFQQSIIEIKTLIEKLLEGGNDFVKSIFIEKYFRLTQQSLTNLNLLISDLSFLKLYLNDLKYNSLNE